MSCGCLPSSKQSDATSATLKVLFLILSACLRGSSNANETCTRKSSQIVAVVQSLLVSAAAQFDPLCVWPRPYCCRLAQHQHYVHAAHICSLKAAVDLQYSAVLRVTCKEDAVDGACACCCAQRGQVRHKTLLSTPQVCCTG